jgi:hypothetical protein
VSITIPEETGIWHVCISTQAGIVDSWWPKGEALPPHRVLAKIDVFRAAGTDSVTIVKPSAVERGKEFEMILDGVEESFFSRVAFALPGQCDTLRQSERVVTEAGPVMMMSPNWTSVDDLPDVTYMICYQQVGQTVYSEQTFVRFQSLSEGRGNSVEYMLLEYLTDPVDSREHGNHLTISVGTPLLVALYGSEFNNNGAVGLSNASLAACIDVIILEKPVLQNGLPLRVLKVSIEGTYDVCYSTSAESTLPVWARQRVSVQAIAKASTTSITEVQCIGAPQHCLPRCNVTVRAQTGVILRFVGAKYKPSAKVAFTEDGDCQNRMLETPLSPDLTVEFAYAKPTTLMLCYSAGDPAPTSIPLTDSSSWNSDWGGCESYRPGQINNLFCVEDPGACNACPVACNNMCTGDLSFTQDESWQLQTTAGVHVSVEPAWDDAGLIPGDASIRIQPAGGGQAITIIGSGFDPKDEFQCHLSLKAGGLGGSKGWTLAEVLSADKVTCAMPPLRESSTLAFFSLRHGKEAGSGYVHNEESDPNRNQMFVVPQVLQMSPICGDKLGGEILSVHGFGFGGPANWSEHLAQVLSDASVLHNNSCIVKCVESQSSSAHCSHVDEARCASLCSANDTRLGCQGRLPVAISECKHPNVLASCNAIENCTGHGQCVGSKFAPVIGGIWQGIGACVCEEGWSGRACELPTSFESMTKAPIQTLLCTSNETFSPACKVVFTGVPPLSNPAITIEVANTDFSTRSEFVARVIVGGQTHGVNYLVDGGEDDNCDKMSKIVDGEMVAIGTVTTDGELEVRIEASQWVGSWTCSDGSTLFARISISHGTAIQYACYFESQVPKDYQSTRPYIRASTVGTLVSPTLITCPTPKWSEEFWDVYRDDLEGVALMLVGSYNWQTKENVQVLMGRDEYFTFESVNKAPDFLGGNLGVQWRESYESPPLVFTNWTRRIWKGRRSNGEDSEDEKGQSVTFVVRARVPSFFEEQPRVSPEGELTFQPVPLKMGTAEFDVQLFDNAGNRGGCTIGRDHSSNKRFQVVFLATEILPKLQTLDIVDVDENAVAGGGLITFNYFGNSFAPPTIPEGADNAALTSNIQFEVYVFNRENYEGDFGQPRIDREGTLTFAPAYGFYGDSTVSFRLVSNKGQEEDFGGFKSTPWSNFTIRVHPINHRPAFSLLSDSVQVLEDCAPWSTRYFAFNISKGLFPEAAEHGVYYTDSQYRTNEANQHVTFFLQQVDGNAELFDALSMSVNGTLAFKLNAHENGWARVRVILRDDGGMVRPFDQDTSDPSYVDITVVPVNDAPVFAFAESLQLVNSSESILLLEHSMSYWHAAANPPDGLYNHFLYNWFWSDFGGNFQGPFNELYQHVSFVLETMTSDTITFDSPPMLRDNGTLALHVGAYSWGESVLSFRAYDDGGTDNTGQNRSVVLQNFTLRITPVNTRPTIGLPSSIYMWVEPYERPNMTQELLYMVAHDCCTPCPGPVCGLFSAPDQCCHASDTLGTMYLETPGLNFSAGPLEDSTQTVSFAISEVGLSGLLDKQASVHIDAKGKMAFKLGTAKAGIVEFEVSVRDDGDMKSLPHQVAQNNQTQRTKLYILSGFVPVWLHLQPPVLRALELHEVRRRLAAYAGIPQELDMVVIDKISWIPVPRGEDLLSAQGMLNRSRAGNHCPLGFSGPGCSLCKHDTYAGSCTANCTVATCNYNGRCNSTNGACVCYSGWTGELCNIDANGTVYDRGCPSACHEKVLIALRVLGVSSDSLFERQEHLHNVSASKLLWIDEMKIGEVQSRSINQLMPRPPRFDLPSVIVVDEDTTEVREIVTNIQVDSTLWARPGQQAIRSTVRLMRTKAPATLPEWHNLSLHNTDSTHLLIVDQGNLSLEAHCEPFCHNATLKLFPRPNMHGLVELLITLETSEGLKTSKKVLVVFQPVPDSPLVFLSPHTIYEDGGFCLVTSCRSLPVSLPAYEFIYDADEWFRSGNRLQVRSSDPMRLNASIAEDNDVLLVLQPGLHQHGTFDLTVSDGDGLYSPRPLTIIVQHVNHPPYLQYPLPNITMNEDAVLDDVVFSNYFTDVDMIDQRDERARIDWMNFSVRMLTPWLLQGAARSENVMMQPVCNMHGLSALTLTATDSYGANVSANILVNILPVPDRPFVQRFLPEAPNGTLLVMENSSVVRINVAFVFGDVDNCSTLIEPTDSDNCSTHCMPPEHGGSDVLILTLNNTRPWKVQAVLEGDELVLEFATFEHSHSPDDIVVTLICTDSFGLVEVLPIRVFVQPVNTVPYPVFVPVVHMIENQAPIYIHITTWEEDPLGEFSFIDKDSGTNYAGDSLQFQVNTSEPSLLSLRMMTLAINEADLECVFPFEFEGRLYSKCTAAGTGGHGPKGYQERFSWCSLVGGDVGGDVREALSSGSVARCKHVLQVSVHVGLFGHAEIGVTATDSYGGVGFGKFELDVSMVNDPPMFSVPPFFEVNSVNALSGSETMQVKYFAVIHTLGFQANISQRLHDIPSPEDVCRIQPVRYRGDCHSLASVLSYDPMSAYAYAPVIVNISIVLDMIQADFDEQTTFWFLTSVAKAAFVEMSMIRILWVSEVQTEGIEEPRLNVVVAIAVGSKKAGELMIHQFTTRNLNHKLLAVGMVKGTVVSGAIVSTNSSWANSSSTQDSNTDSAWQCPYSALEYCPGTEATIGQTATFFVQQIDGDLDIFRISPQINRDGTLLYQVAHSRSGRTTFTITLIDDGGIAHGGVNHSTQVLIIDVLNVNIRPYFEVSPSLDLVENANAGPIVEIALASTQDRRWTQHAFVYDINPGGGKHEEEQKLTFFIQQIGGMVGLLTDLPSISPNGTLALELSQDKHGTSLYSVYLVDDSLANRVDESGWARSEYNDNTSVTKEFEIRVEQLNNPPVFCLPTTLELVEDDHTRSWIPVSQGASTTDCSDPLFLPFGLEGEQNLTFTVFAAEGDLLRDRSSKGLGCAPFDYDHTDVRDDDSGGEHVREPSWFRIYANGSLDVRAANAGETDVTIVLRDDGGVAFGGLNSTTQTLHVKVFNVNDAPFFELLLHTVRVFEGSVLSPPARVITNVSSGRCERPPSTAEQQVSFALSVLNFCVPDCPESLPLDASASRADQAHRLFEDGGSFQLFQSSDLRPGLNANNGNLVFALAPNRNGRVLFQVEMSDGSLSISRRITIVVDPVNSVPSFALETNRLAFHQELQMPDVYATTAFDDFSVDRMLFQEAFVVGISAGAFNEQSQALLFGIRSLSNTGLVTCVEVICDNSTPLGANCHSRPDLGLTWTSNFTYCSESAALRVWPAPSRYGDEEFEIVMYDDGPMLEDTPSTFDPTEDEIEDQDPVYVNGSVGPVYAGGGWLGAPLPVRTFSRVFSIHMVHFRLATSVVQVLEDSNCVSVPPFGADLSHGSCDRSGQAFEHVRGGFVLDVPPVAQQNAAFIVLQDGPPDRSPPTSTMNIFAEPPSISADGTLRFVLTENAFGSTNFTVTLEDAALLRSNTLSFAIQVVNVNDRPNLVVPKRIISFESEAFHFVVGTSISRDASGNDVLDWEYDQSLTFEIVVHTTDRRSLFIAPPVLSEIDKRKSGGAVVAELSFDAVPLAYGSTNLTVVVHDNGGVSAGGEDTISLEFVVEVVAINEAPTFEMLDSIFIFENSSRYVVPNFAVNMSAGPANERGLCDKYPGDCENQALRLDLVSLENPNLLTDLPSVDEVGTLSFRPCEYCAGRTSFCMIIIDSGAIFASFTDCKPCTSALSPADACCYGNASKVDENTGERDLGFRSSAEKCARIHIEPVDDRPGFELAWDVNCSVQARSTASVCTCPFITDPSLVRMYDDEKYLGFLGEDSSDGGPVCRERRLEELLRPASVVVIEDAGPQQIKNFATSIVAIEGFNAPSRAIFGGDHPVPQSLESADISFRGRRTDPLSTTRGLEYAISKQQTADGILYFAEPETDSISVWTRGENSSEPVFLDRRTNREVRLRFRGLEDVDPVLMSVDGHPLPDLQGVCSLVRGNKTTDLMAGAGCQLLHESRAFENNQTFKSEPEWEYVVGDWMFNTEAVYNSEARGVMKTNRFSQDVPQTVDCSGSFCRYKRPRLATTLFGETCEERYGTDIGPAAFRDRSNVLGAAVYRGGPFDSAGINCKDLTSEFDTPKEHTLSVVNLIASAGEMEAMYFDPAVAAGLFITDDIDELVTGIPSSSKLPLAELTADILFTAGVEDMVEHPLFSAMQRTVCGDATRPVDCGCDKGLRITWRWADPTVGQLTFSMAIALELPSADVNNYGEHFLKFTKTDVGPGVGFVQYFEWTSEAGFVSAGDWIHMGVTYDGKTARFFNNDKLLYEQHMCRSSCPENDPECVCGNIIYPADYHRCPKFCKCPTEECERLQCPCGSNGGTAGKDGTNFKVCMLCMSPMRCNVFVVKFVNIVT